MKKGLFGGTFDPVHFGHVRIVETIRDGFGLDEIFIVPASIPPHKDARQIADGSDRLKMARMAFKGIRGATVSDIELKHAGKSYTIDTITLFLNSAAHGTSLYLIMGLDSFLEIHTWKSYMEIFRLLPIIVYARMTKQGAGQDIFESYLASTVSDRYTFSAARSCYTDPSLQPIYFYRGELIDISSTDIRKRIRTGRPISGHVPEPVEKYIIERGLYL